MQKLFTTLEVSETLRCHKSTVIKWGNKIGLGAMIGVQRVFTPAEVRILKKRVRPGPGNPDFGTKEAAMRGVNARHTRT